MITFGQAKALLSQYAGRAGFCPSSSDVEVFTYKVLQQLLWSGEYGNLRKFVFCAVKGCFTVPYEIEVIEKVALDGEVATAWSKWCEWHPGRGVLSGFCIAANEVIEDPNYYPTVYDLPNGGSRVGVMGTCDEGEEAHVIVKGKDITGREVITDHQGVQIPGEYLSIRKGELRYSSVSFSEVSGIVKTPTKGYTQLLWVKKSVCDDSLTHGFLSDYSPVEEHPSYRRYRITSPRCGRLVKVSCLARIRLKEKYLDNDYIPFENYLALETQAQAIQSNYNNQVDVAITKDKYTQELISRENEYKKVNNGASPIEMYLPLSGGAIKPIVFGKI